MGGTHSIVLGAASLGITLACLAACTASSGSVEGGDTLSSLTEADWQQLCERSKDGAYGLSDADLSLLRCRIVAGGELSSASADDDQSLIAACESSVEACLEKSDQGARPTFTAVCNTREARARYADCDLTVDAFEECFAAVTNDNLDSLSCEEQVALLSSASAELIRPVVTVDDCKALQTQCPDVIGTPEPGSD